MPKKLLPGGPLCPSASNSITPLVNSIASRRMTASPFFGWTLRARFPLASSTHFRVASAGTVPPFPSAKAFKSGVTVFSPAVATSAARATTATDNTTATNFSLLRNMLFQTPFLRAKACTEGTTADSGHAINCETSDSRPSNAICSLRVLPRLPKRAPRGHVEFQELRPPANHLVVRDAPELAPKTSGLACIHILSCKEFERFDILEPDARAG